MADFLLPVDDFETVREIRKCSNNDSSFNSSVKMYNQYLISQKDLHIIRESIIDNNSSI